MPLTGRPRQQKAAGKKKAGSAGGKGSMGRAGSRKGKTKERKKRRVSSWTREDFLSGMDIKKYVLPCLPYLAVFWFFTKAGESYRMADGSGAMAKAVYGLSALGTLVKNSPFPSVCPRDLLAGLAGAAAVWTAVYLKGKNAKKYRPGVEHGSARWGNAEDIKPFISPKFADNILLTQTERIMLGRNKSPKYNINKNVLIIGGSGSGKTRFHVKPNLMQMNASYVVTDPNR